MSKVSLLTLALATVVGASTPAAADPGNAGEDRIERLLRRFDRNGDGALDRQELRELGHARAARRDPARRQQRFAKLVARFDANRDGRLGPGEVPPELARRLVRFDRNGDGWVDAAEVAAAPQRKGRAPGAFRP